MHFDHGAESDSDVELVMGPVPSINLDGLRGMAMGNSIAYGKLTGLPADFGAEQPHGRELEVEPGSVMPTFPAAITGYGLRLDPGSYALTGYPVGLPVISA